MSSSEILVDLDATPVDFTELPPSKLCCRSCKKVLRNPHGSKCCNAIFCKKCVKTSKCSACGVASPEVVFDELAQRSINELYVRCFYVADGCLWFGRLEHLPQHIAMENANGCVFASLACPYECGGKYSRKVLKEHMNTRCSKRPYDCEYCGKYSGTYEGAELDHFTECLMYPVPCPNKCPQQTVPRSKLDFHVKNECEHQENVSCHFEFAGCRTKLQRKDMITHLEENLVDHVTLFTTAFMEHKKEVEDKMATVPRMVIQEASGKSGEIDSSVEELLKEKDQEIRRLKIEIQQVRKDKDDQINTMQVAVNGLKKSLELQETRLSLAESQNHTLMKQVGRLRQFVPSPLPITFTINKFEQLRQNNKWWYSRPFYSHVGGYKLGMFVFCNGVMDGKGTHLSVFVYLVRGEYDEELDWPFRGSVVVHLLNQRGDRGHYQKVIRFTDDTPAAVCNQVKEAEMAKEGNGPTQFISHADLTYNAERDIEFLRDDCIKVRLVSISLKGHTKAPSSSGTSSTPVRKFPSQFKIHDKAPSVSLDDEVKSPPPTPPHKSSHHSSVTSSPLTNGNHTPTSENHTSNNVSNGLPSTPSPTRTEDSSPDDLAKIQSVSIDL